MFRKSHQFLNILRAIKANDGRGNEGFIHEEAIEVVVAREEKKVTTKSKKSKKPENRILQNGKKRKQKKIIEENIFHEKAISQQQQQEIFRGEESFHQEEEPFHQEEQILEDNIVGPSSAAVKTLNDENINAQAVDGADGSKDEAKKKKKKRLVFVHYIFKLSFRKVSKRIYFLEKPIQIKYKENTLLVKIIKQQNIQIDDIIVAKDFVVFVKSIYSHL